MRDVRNQSGDWQARLRPACKAPVRAEASSARKRLASTALRSIYEDPLCFSRRFLSKSGTAQLGEAPENHTKKQRSASIDAGGIANFVGNPGIILGVNRDIPAGEQVWQRHRHQRALHHSADETRRMGILVQ